MNRFNKIMVSSLAAILLTAMSVEPPKIKVYLITSYRGNDLTMKIQQIVYILCILTIIEPIIIVTVKSLILLKIDERTN